MVAFKCGLMSSACKVLVGSSGSALQQPLLKVRGPGGAGLGSQDSVPAPIQAVADGPPQQPSASEGALQASPAMCQQLSFAPPPPQWPGREAPTPPLQAPLGTRALQLGLSSLGGLEKGQKLLLWRLGSHMVSVSLLRAPLPERTGGRPLAS